MKKILLTTAFALLIGAAPTLANAKDWRDDNPHAQWDTSRHNGYYWQNKWHYGQPPAAYRDKPDLHYGWHDWRRGERIPRAELSRYSAVDYRAHHLRRPPRGYRWVQDDKGDYILAALATGLIAQAIINSH